MSSNPWISWTKLGETELDVEAHLNAFGWAILSVIFGFIVLSFDTRNVLQLSGSNRRLIRDRIFGLEQRYFLVLWNGLLLYATLLWKYHGNYGKENIMPR